MIAPSSTQTQVTFFGEVPCQADTIVQYILNGQPLSDSAAPGKLFLITDKNFKAIEVIDKEMLPSASVSPKRYVVAVRAKYPKGLVKASNAK